MPQTPRPTLRSLAAEAGVSVATMSFALRGLPEVSAATRDRLRAFATSRGYRLNPLVAAVYSQVRTRKSQGDHNVIAYLNTWWPRRAWETCNTKTGQFRGASQRATELGFRVQNFWLREPGMSPARLAEIFKARGIRGILIGPMQDQNAPFDFPWRDFALATIGYSLHAPAISRACHAHFRGMHRAMDELIAHGYKRIGYVTSQDLEERVNSLWGAAYRLNQHRLSARDRIAPLVFEADARRGMLERWLARTRPDAIVNALPGVFELLTDLGLRPPAGMGFVHLDLPTHLKNGNVTGVDQLWEVVGAGAVVLVANQLYTNTSGLPAHPVTHLVEGTWIEGGTLRTSVQRAERAKKKTRLPKPSRASVRREPAAGVLEHIKE
jgi:LacI family transcriptional regulator